MKSFRKFLSISLAVLMLLSTIIVGTASVSAADTTELYCKVTQSWWTADGAAVGVHYWGGSSETTWPGVKGTPVAGEEGLWKFEVPSDATGFVFVRMGNSGTEDGKDWGAQTGDLTLPTDGKNLYTITSAEPVWGSKPGVAGEWSTYGSQPTQATTAPTTATTAPTTVSSNEVVVNIKSQQNLFATETRTYKKGDVFDLSILIDMKGKKPLDTQIETYLDHTGLKVISETVHEKLEDTAVTNITDEAQTQYDAVYFNFASAKGYNITSEATLVTYKVQVLDTAKSTEEMVVNYLILRAVESDPTNPVNCIIDSIVCDADFAVKVAVSPSAVQPTTATTVPTTAPSNEVVVNIKSQQNLFATETRTYKKGDVFDLSILIDMKGKKPLDAQIETYLDHTGLKVISETVHEKLEDTAVTNITDEAQTQYDAVYFNFASAKGYNITSEATLVTYKVQVLDTAKSTEEMVVNYLILRAVESDPTNPVNCIIDSIVCDADFAVKVAVSPSAVQPTTATTAPTTAPTTQPTTAPTTEAKPVTYTYYFAPLQSDVDAGCTYVVNVCSDADVANPWSPYTMEATEDTFNGKPVYKAEITVPQTQNIMTMQIQSFENGTWKHQIVVVDNKATPYSTYDGKIIVAADNNQYEVMTYVADPVTQPTTATTEPTTESTEPTTESQEDVTTEPTTETTEPTTETTEPTTETTEPTTESTEPTTEPVPVFDYYVVGSPELFGANWAEDPANGMTKGVDGNYYLAIENAPAGTFNFKVKDSNGGWHPEGMGNDGVVTTTGGEKVIFRYDPNAGFAVVSTDGNMPTYPIPTVPTETTEPTTVPTQPTTQETQPTTQATQPTTKPQTIGEADKTITKTDTDNGDPKGSTFALLRLNQKSKGKTTMNLSWTKVKGAKGYIIYGAKCGQPLKKIKTVSAKTTKYTVKKLKKGTYYKYLVVAYKTSGKSKVTCAMSKVTHATTKGGKYGNPTKITKVKDKVTVKKGKKITLKPSFKYDKKVKKHVGIRYESTNTKVAKVSSKGVIKGIAKGKKCTVYVYAQNGVYKKVTVSVK